MDIDDIVLMSIHAIPSQQQVEHNIGLLLAKKSKLNQRWFDVLCLLGPPQTRDAGPATVQCWLALYYILLTCSHFVPTCFLCDETSECGRHKKGFRDMSWRSKARIGQVCHNSMSWSIVCWRHYWKYGFYCPVKSDESRAQGAFYFTPIALIGACALMNQWSIICD